MSGSGHPPLLATWLLRRLLRGTHSDALQGDLFEGWRGGRGNSWYWRQVLRAVIASLCRSSLSILRSTRLWIAVAALGITAGGLFAIPVSVSLGMRALMRVASANHGKWWWSLLVHVLTWSPLTLALIVGFARRRRDRLPPA
jgi:hypothetical protein